MNHLGLHHFPHWELGSYETGSLASYIRGIYYGYCLECETSWWVGDSLHCWRKQEVGKVSQNNSFGTIGFQLMWNLDILTLLFIIPVIFA